MTLFFPPRPLPQPLSSYAMRSRQRRRWDKSPQRSATPDCSEDPDQGEDEAESDQHPTPTSGGEPEVPEDVSPADLCETKEEEEEEEVSGNGDDWEDEVTGSHPEDDDDCCGDPEECGGCAVMGRHPCDCYDEDCCCGD